ncbi:MAG: serine/threonine protein kinase, partial [Clostridiales bacterium]|nr:serine/threonine protein kinase [Clostridiales bacterium]
MEIKGVKEPIFGNWYVDEKIGSGSFGMVYRLKREDFGKTYYSALKVIRIPLDESELRSIRSEFETDESLSDYYSQFVQDFAKEIELMAELKGNSNIVSFEDHQFIRNEDGIGWTILIRMELLTPFADYQRENEIDNQAVVKLGIDICSALELCEMRKIIHRDIKPDNIFLSDKGDFKLGDFGIARELEKTTGGLSKKGTYSYMAPEVYTGKPYNNTVDIYSLGIVMYKL